jgi:hypothetical protein
VLEGGYNPVNVANGVEAVFAALTNSMPENDHHPSPYREPEFKSRVEAVRRLHNL